MSKKIKLNPDQVRKLSVVAGLSGSSINEVINRLVDQELEASKDKLAELALN